jgi:hypothetical protein
MSRIFREKYEIRDKIPTVQPVRLFIINILPSRARLIRVGVQGQ